MMKCNIYSRQQIYDNGEIKMVLLEKDAFVEYLLEGIFYAKSTPDSPVGVSYRDKNVIVIPTEFDVSGLAEKLYYERKCDFYNHYVRSGEL